MENKRVRSYKKRKRGKRKSRERASNKILNNNNYSFISFKRLKLKEEDN